MKLAFIILPLVSIKTIASLVSDETIILPFGISAIAMGTAITGLVINGVGAARLALKA
jgi:hypothetical protein